MSVFFPAGLHFLSVGNTVSPPNTDVTQILQFISQPKEVGEFLFFIKSAFLSYIQKSYLSDFSVEIFFI